VVPETRLKSHQPRQDSYWPIALGLTPPRTIPQAAALRELGTRFKLDYPISLGRSCLIDTV